MTGQRFVVVGGTTTARRVCAALLSSGHEVRHLVAPTDSELTRAVSEASRVDGVAILLHNDDLCLRYALAVAHAAPSVRIVVSIFDATVSEQIRLLLPNCVVSSPGGLAAPVLAAACLAPGAAALGLDQGRAGTEYVVLDGTVTRRTWRRTHPRAGAFQSWLASQALPHDTGSLLLVAGLVGIAAMVVLDWVWLRLLGVPGAEAFQKAVAVVATVGAATHHGAAYAIYSGIAMLLTLFFAAMFTAGLVDQLLGPRLVGLFGPRALPRRGHVIVVGLGQVGLKLCRHLLALGVPVVGVERDATSRYLAMARSLRIPVVVGHGGDRSLLERLRIRQATALAAVGSADLDNIAVAVAARGVEHRARVVVRAGEHEAIGETASLLPLGETRDITELTAAFVIAQLYGRQVAMALSDGREVAVETHEGEYVAWRTTNLDTCAHGRAPVSE